MSVVFLKAFEATLFNLNIFPQTPCLTYTWIEKKKKNLEEDPLQTKIDSQDINMSFSK